MIELYAMNEQFMIIGVIDNFSSLQWNTRYYGVGDFEIHCSRKLLDLLGKSTYIFREDSNYTGIITNLCLSDNDLYIKGRFLEFFLERRVLDKPRAYVGLAEDAMRTIVRDICINNNERKIERLALGERRGIGGQIELCRESKSLQSLFTELCIQQGISYNLRYDWFLDKIFFEVFEGLDRTQDQNINQWCIFSKNFENVLREKYEVCREEKTVAYVAGNYKYGDITERVYQIVETPGGARNEVFVDARDIHQTEGQSQSGYKNLLKQRGLEKLADYSAVHSVACDIDPTRTMKFGLGDVCDYINEEVGIRAKLRVTEILETVEDPPVPLRIIIGREKPTQIKALERKLTT